MPYRQQVAAAAKSESGNVGLEIRSRKVRPRCRLMFHAQNHQLFGIERDGKYVLGLVNTGNSCFVNSVLQVCFPVCKHIHISLSRC